MDGMDDGADDGASVLVLVGGMLVAGFVGVGVFVLAVVTVFMAVGDIIAVISDGVDPACLAASSTNIFITSYPLLLFSACGSAGGDDTDNNVFFIGANNCCNVCCTSISC